LDELQGKELRIKNIAGDHPSWEEHATKQKSVARRTTKATTQKTLDSTGATKEKQVKPRSYGKWKRQFFNKHAKGRKNLSALDFETQTKKGRVGLKTSRQALAKGASKGDQETGIKVYKFFHPRHFLLGGGVDLKNCTRYALYGEREGEELIP